MGCTENVLDEFQGRKFLPTGEDPILFVTPQVRLNSGFNILVWENTLFQSSHFG